MKLFHIANKAWHVFDEIFFPRPNTTGIPETKSQHAYLAGRKAYLDGTANPHLPGSDMYESWVQGYADEELACKAL